MGAVVEEGQHFVLGNVGSAQVKYRHTLALVAISAVLAAVAILAVNILHLPVAVTIGQDILSVLLVS